MISKDMLLFICLGTFFLIVSLGVYVTKGKNAYLLAKKLRIGAFLITLSFSLGLVGCEKGEPPPPMCYDPVSTFIEFEEDTDSDYNLDVSLSETKILSGTVNFGLGSPLKYKITQTDEDNTVIEYDSGVLEADDGEFDSSQEEFTITLNPHLEPGQYNLDICEFSNTQEWVISSFKLNIYE